MSQTSPLARSFLSVLLIAVACFAVWLLSSVHSLDFNVYRAGARAFLGLEGATELYDRQLWHVSGDSWLPFTYPAFAVLFFLPYAYLPPEVGSLLHTGVLIAAMLVVVHLFVTRKEGLMAFLRRRTPWQGAAFVGLIVFTVGFSGPWREGLSFGQINAVLMAVIMVDLLSKRRFGLPRGFLTGIAAGIKLTPLAMGLYFLAQRDWKALVWMATGFVSTVGIGFLLTPSGSGYFWTEALFTTSRVGSDADMYSLTLKSFTQRLGLSDTSESIAWVVLSLLTIGMGYLGIRRLLASRETVAAVGVAAIVMLMISPISWYHHWVWFILLLPAMVFPATPQEQRVGRAMRLSAAVLYLLFVFSSYTLSILYFGVVQGHGPWWLELLSSVWMFAAAGAVISVVVRSRPVQDSVEVTAGVGPVSDRAGVSGSAGRGRPSSSSPSGHF